MNAAPSMLTSYDAIPEPASDPVQETASSGAIGTLGEFAMTEGAVPSTFIEADFAGSEYPSASVA